MPATAQELLFADLLIEPTVVRIRRDAEVIATSLPPLHDIVKQFAVADDLLPAECDEAILAVNALGQPASNLGRIFKQRDSLPRALVPHRLDLLVSLCFIESKSRETATEIAHFRLICSNPYPQIARQRTAIYRRIEALLRAGDRLTKQIIPLLGSHSPVPARLVRAS